MNRSSIFPLYLSLVFFAVQSNQTLVYGDMPQAEPSVADAQAFVHNYAANLDWQFMLVPDNPLLASSVTPVGDIDIVVVGEGLFLATLEVTFEDSSQLVNLTVWLSGGADYLLFLDAETPSARFPVSIRTVFSDYQLAGTRNVQVLNIVDDRTILPGDANLDGDVDTADLAALQSRKTRSKEDACTFNIEFCTPLVFYDVFDPISIRVDIDQDGVIGNKDENALLANLNDNDRRFLYASFVERIYDSSSILTSQSGKLITLDEDSNSEVELFAYEIDDSGTIISTNIYEDRFNGSETERFILWENTEEVLPDEFSPPLSQEVTPPTEQTANVVTEYEPCATVGETPCAERLPTTGLWPKNPTINGFGAAYGISGDVFQYRISEGPYAGLTYDIAGNFENGRDISAGIVLGLRVVQYDSVSTEQVKLIFEDVDGGVDELIVEGLSVQPTNFVVSEQQLAGLSNVNLSRIRTISVVVDDSIVSFPDSEEAIEVRIDPLNLVMDFSAVPVANVKTAAGSLASFQESSIPSILGYDPEVTSVKFRTYDLENDPVAFSNIGEIEAPENGRLELASDGKTLTYTPNQGFSGLESLRYDICTEGACDRDYISIIVLPNGIYAQDDPLETSLLAASREAREAELPPSLDASKFLIRGVRTSLVAAFEGAIIEAGTQGASKLGATVSGDYTKARTSFKTKLGLQDVYKDNDIYPTALYDEIEIKGKLKVTFLGYHPETNDNIYEVSGTMYSKGNWPWSTVYSKKHSSLGVEVTIAAEINKIRYRILIDSLSNGEPIIDPIAADGVEIDREFESKAIFDGFVTYEYFRPSGLGNGVNFGDGYEHSSAIAEIISKDDISGEGSTVFPLENRYHALFKVDQLPLDSNYDEFKANFYTLFGKEKDPIFPRMYSYIDQKKGFERSTAVTFTPNAGVMPNSGLPYNLRIDNTSLDVWDGPPHLTARDWDYVRIRHLHTNNSTVLFSNHLSFLDLEQEFDAPNWAADVLFTKNWLVDSLKDKDDDNRAERDRPVVTSFLDADTQFVLLRTTEDRNDWRVDYDNTNFDDFCLITEIFDIGTQHKTYENGVYESEYAFDTDNTNWLNTITQNEEFDNVGHSTFYGDEAQFIITSDPRNSYDFDYSLIEELAEDSLQTTIGQRGWESELDDEVTTSVVDEVASTTTVQDSSGAETDTTHYYRSYGSLPFAGDEVESLYVAFLQEKDVGTPSETSTNEQFLGTLSHAQKDFTVNSITSPPFPLLPPDEAVDEANRRIDSFEALDLQYEETGDDDPGSPATKPFPDVPDDADVNPSLDNLQQVQPGSLVSRLPRPVKRQLRGTAVSRTKQARRRLDRLVEEVSQLIDQRKADKRRAAK